MRGHVYGPKIGHADGIFTSLGSLLGELGIQSLPMPMNEVKGFAEIVSDLFLIEILKYREHTRQLLTS